MDLPEFSAGKSPRRELQGPRPTPLKVRKDSHKIRKPPVAPQPQPQPPSQQPAQPRPPVIIYTVSPKVIHTSPSDFMTLVQRLTGSSTTNSATITSDNAGGVSPAARLATIESAKSSPRRDKLKPQSGDHHGHGHDHDHDHEPDHMDGLIEGIEIRSEVERPVAGMFPGILSPAPASLQPIPSNFFSPPSDPNPFTLFHDLSPVLQGHRSYWDPTFMPSPSNFLSPCITSPTPSLDIFNNFSDF